MTRHDDPTSGRGPSLVPYPPGAVANFFLAKSGEITQMKLHKLLYYAQGWYLAVAGKPLLNETITAWKHGPVVPSLYYDLKKFGARPIDRLTRTIDRQTHVRYSPQIDPDDSVVRGLLERIWGVYGALSGQQLSQMTMPRIRRGRGSAGRTPSCPAWTSPTKKSGAIFGSVSSRGGRVAEELQRGALQQIVEADLPDDAEDHGAYLAEAQEFEEGAKALRLDDRRELLKDRKQDRRERKRYAELVFRLVCWWLIAVMALVCSTGLAALRLDEAVLLTIVGSTTASVVAIFAVVAKYLFPPRS